MEVILDTNFIVSCVRRKIDFLNELENLGFKIYWQFFGNYVGIKGNLFQNKNPLCML